MTELTNQELKSIDGGISFPITGRDILDAFKTLRETVRDWGHTDGCLSLQKNG